MVKRFARPLGIVAGSCAVAVGLEMCLAYAWLVYGPMPGDVWP